MSDMNSSRSDAPGWEVTPDQLKQLGMFYHCRAGCLYQDGSTSKAPTLLFAGADYEPGDGPTRLHDDAKYVDEPAIIYVRLDSYLAALKPAPTDEPEPNTPPNRLMPDVNACGVWCPSCGAHLESPARSGTRRIIGKEALERLAVAALQLDEGKFDARHDYREALEELRVIAASEAGNCTSGQNDGPELHGNTKAARAEAEPDERTNLARQAWKAAFLSWAARSQGEDTQPSEAHVSEPAKFEHVATDMLSAQPSGWQPIETAPKDGSCIIVRCEIATVEIVRNAFWDDGEFWRGTGFSSQEELAGWWSPTSSCGSEKLEDLYEPTHWMPLPPAPGEDTQPETTPSKRHD